MKRKFFSTLLIAALLMSTVLSACSGGSSNPPETTGDAGSKISISVCGGGEDAMVVNPQTVTTLQGLSAVRHLFEGLYKLDQKGDVVLGQASDVKIDGLTYTFTLRDDINWSDGKPVVAADFVYGWKYLKECGSDYSGLLGMIGDAQAPDDKTVVVTLAYPCAYLPSVLAFASAYPARQDIVEQYGEAYATDPEKAVYNGAYKMTSWTHQQSLVMDARPEYYGAEAITVANITWDLMTDASTMLASFKSGDIIYSDNYPEAEASALKGAGLSFSSGYNAYCTVFNVSDKGPAIFKDVKVRKALSLAIDRERIVSIRGVDDELANTYSPSGLKNSAGVEFNSTVAPWFDVSAYAANCETAKQLLSEAGYAGGAGFPALKYIVNNAARKEIAEAVVGDWKEVLGIDTITVEVVDAFFAQRSSYDYDISYFGWFMDYPDISNMLYTFVSGSSDSGYTNPAYDAAYNTATAALEVDAQWASYKECERILAEDAPVAPILHQQNSYLFDDTNYQGLVYYCGNFYFGYVTKN
jgi:oligopeptide transport system substrate-binding protein